MTDEEIALAGVEALTGFIKELGLPSTFTEMGITDRELLRKAAYSCNISAVSYSPMTHEEIYDIFTECM